MKLGFLEKLSGVFHIIILSGSTKPLENNIIPS